MKPDSPLFFALGRFARGFILTFLGVFIATAIVGWLANNFGWPAFALQAGSVRIYSFQPGSNGSLGIGVFHLSMLVGLINGALTFLRTAKEREDN